MTISSSEEVNLESSEPEEKRQLLNFLLQNLKLEGKNLVFELKTPFNTVLQASKSHSLLPSSKLVIIMENRDYMTMLKEKLSEIKGVYRNFKLSPAIITY